VQILTTRTHKGHTGISVRRPQAKRVTRSTKSNSEDTKTVYENLTSVLMTLQFSFDKAEDITDRTGVTAVHKRGRIVAEEGDKCFGVPVTWESGRNVAVVCSTPVNIKK